jgi:3-dehydroquinate dehydratase/shikimate dehydrogenase
MTHLACAIHVADLEQALRDASQAAEQGADLAEYRVDRFIDDPTALAGLFDRSPLACIVTCRSAREGGFCTATDLERIEGLEAAMRLAVRKPAYLDIELATYRQSAEMRGRIDALVGHDDRGGLPETGLILSTHDFDGRPAALYQRIEAMAEAPACRVIKVAWRARSLRDNLEALEIIGRRHKPTIALCMGDFGLPSRVLAGKAGALVTYAAARAGEATAPGQPTVGELKRLYRWDAIRADTRVYGVIGDPVGHSMSPAIHNAGFEHVGFNGVYLPMQIPAAYEHFKATVDSWIQAPGIDFMGASVTIPHKQNLLRFVREQGGEVEDMALKLGAANTLVVSRTGPEPAVRALNTDYAAALDAVCAGLDIGRGDVSGRRVAVMGAGGVARAVVAGFAHCGATVVIYNRTFERARELAEQFADGPGKVVPARLEKLCDSCCGIFVNCTSLGMHPNEQDTPMSFSSRSKDLEPGTVVFDTVYNPPQTRLLREAKAAGCLTIAGAEMFVRQAAAQFSLWTQAEAPLDLFRRVMAGELAKQEGTKGRRDE